MLLDHVTCKQRVADNQSLESSIPICLSNTNFQRCSFSKKGFTREVLHVRAVSIFIIQLSKKLQLYSNAKPLGSLGLQPPPTHTPLKDDSWVLHKSDEIFLPLGGGTPAFRDGILHHTADHSLQHKAQPDSPSGGNMTVRRTLQCAK